MKKQQAIDMINKIIHKDHKCEEPDIEVKNIGVWNLSCMKI